MPTDTGTIVGIVIAAIFAGVLALLKFMMPYIKKRSEPPTPPAIPSAADRSGGVMALDYGELSDTGRGQPPWKQLNDTLTSMNETVKDINSKDFATTEDVQRFSDTMSKRIDQVEAKTAANANQISYVKGRLSNK